MADRNITYSLFALGDLASRATHEEYKSVEEALIEVAMYLNIPKKRIFICPGNHDYELDMCKMGKEDSCCIF